MSALRKGFGRASSKASIGANSASTDGVRFVHLPRVQHDNDPTVPERSNRILSLGLSFGSQDALRGLRFVGVRDPDGQAGPRVFASF